MDTVQLSPRLHLLPLWPFQAYAYLGDDGVSLIDTGARGSHERVQELLAGLGHADPAELRQIVLTHHHDDHAGNAAALAAWSGCRVLAHRGDVAVVEGRQPATPPEFLDWELPIHQQVAAGLLPADPVVVDEPLDGGLRLAGLGDAEVVHVPSHTRGSVALHFPAEGVLLTGDVLASQAGELIPGLFNVAPSEVTADLRRLAELHIEVAGVGHGEPVRTAAAARLRRLLG